jgi:hypothetical protein
MQGRRIDLWGFFHWTPWTPEDVFTPVRLPPKTLEKGQNTSEACRRGQEEGQTDWRKHCGFTINPCREIAVGIPPLAVFKIVELRP